MRKRLLSLLLSMAMSVCLVCALSAPAYAVVAEDVNASATTEVVVESTQPVSVLEEEPEQEPTVESAEKETDASPLTPDGNSNLQDDSRSKNKEFITIQSKNGRYYYLVIDRDRADNNAYLLSQIDEGDLKEFLEEEEEITEPVTTIVEQPAEKSEEEEPKEDPKPTGNNSLTFLLLAAAAGGGFYYFKVLKPKQEQNRGEREIESAEFQDDEVEREEDDNRSMMAHQPYPETGDEEVDD